MLSPLAPVLPLGPEGPDGPVGPVTSFPVGPLGPLRPLGPDGPDIVRPRDLEILQLYLITFHAFYNFLTNLLSCSRVLLITFDISTEQGSSGASSQMLHGSGI